jgi:hypothetical protein
VTREEQFVDAFAEAAQAAGFVAAAWPKAVIEGG